MFPDTRFLLQSKAPRVFLNQLVIIPNNVYLGTTIETNRFAGYSDWSRAPNPRFRYEDMVNLGGPHLLISIEPVMDFDVDMLVKWLNMIRPAIIFIGADNYHAGLPEPSWDRVQELLVELRKFVPTVVEKQGLERLRK